MHRHTIASSHCWQQCSKRGGVPVPVVNTVPATLPLLLLLLSVVGAIKCPDGSAGLTRALYEAGDPSAYADVTCVPKNEFMHYDNDVILKDGLLKMKSFETNAFRSARKVTISGSYPLLEIIGLDAFNSVRDAGSSIKFNTGLSLLVSIGSHAFRGFKGTIALAGAFPSLRTIGPRAFYYASHTSSTVAIACSDSSSSSGALEIAHDAFGGFEGKHDATGEQIACGMTTTSSTSTFTSTTTSTSSATTTTTPANTPPEGGSCSWRDEASEPSDGNVGITVGALSTKLMLSCSGFSDMSFEDSPRGGWDHLGNSDTLQFTYAWTTAAGVTSLVHNEVGESETATAFSLPGGTVEIVYTIVGVGGGSTIIKDTIEVTALDAAATEAALNDLSANIADRPASESLALISMLAASSDASSAQSDTDSYVDVGGEPAEPTAEELAAQDSQRQDLMNALGSVLDILSGPVKVITGLQSDVFISIGSGTVLDAAASNLFCGLDMSWDASAFDLLEETALVAYYKAIQDVANFPPFADDVEIVAEYATVVIQYTVEGGEGLFVDVDDALCVSEEVRGSGDIQPQRRNALGRVLLRMVYTATAVDVEFNSETVNAANGAFVSNVNAIQTLEAAFEKFDAVGTLSIAVLVEKTVTTAIESVQVVKLSADQADAMVSGVTNVLGGESPPVAMSADSAFQAAGLLTALAGSGAVSAEGANKVGQAVSNIFASTSALSADESEDLVGSVLSSMTSVNVNLAKSLEEGAPPIQTASADGSFKSASGKAACDIDGTTHIECGALSYDIPNTWLFKKVSGGADGSGGSGSSDDGAVYECENVFTTLGFKDNPHTWTAGSDGLGSTGSLDLFAANGNSASRHGLADCATINIDTSAGIEATYNVVGAQNYTVNEFSSTIFSVTKKPIEDANKTIHVVVEPLHTVEGGAPSRISVSMSADYFDAPVESTLTSVRTFEDWSARSIVDPSFVFQIIPERLSHASCSSDAAIADAGDLNNTDGQFIITVTTDAADDLNLIVYIFDSECLFLDEDTNTWSDRDCVPSGLTTTGMLKCKCNHLTNFGGKSAPRGVLVPNFVDFAKVITADDIADNPIIFAVVSTIWIVFVMLMIKAYREDQRNQVAVGPVAVASNSGLHLGAYRVTVKTGIRPNAGLGHESRVFIQMVGSRGTSSWVELGHLWRPLFLRNATDVFRVTTPLDIGVIKSITIKHDNNGYDPRWFLSHVEVTNLVRGSSSQRFFWISEWLADDMENSSLQHTAKGETAEEASFAHAFQEHLFYKIADQHTFASVFLAAPSSTFTKLERTMCCMVFFTGTVMCNAMFYPVDGSVLSIGEMIQKSVYSVAIVTGITTIIVYLFRHSASFHKPLHKQGSVVAMGLAFATTVAIRPVLDGIAASKPAGTTRRRSSSTTAAPGSTRRRSSSTTAAPGSTRRKTSIGTTSRFATETSGQAKSGTHKHTALGNLVRDQGVQEELDDMQDMLANINAPVDEADEAGMDKLNLPWWCGPLAWVLSFAGTISASIYIIQFSMQYGSQVSRRWLGSFMMSLMTMMLFSDPLIIVLIVLMFMLVFKQDVGASTSTDMNMTTEKEIVKANATVVAKFHRLRYAKAKDMPHHRSMAKVDENAKRKRQRINNETSKILKDTVGHFLFYLVLSIVMYNQKDDRVFAMLGGVRTIVHVMPDDAFAATPMMAGSYMPGTNTLGTPSGSGYNAISSQEDFWGWAIAAIPPLFVVDNHGRLINGGGELRLLGGVRIRQLRVTPATCKVPASIAAWLPNDECNAGWGGDTNNNEDMMNFAKINRDEVPINRKYDGTDECPTFRGYFATGVYDGCGYVQDFTNSTSDLVFEMLATLRDERWLDNLSRLIQVEFTVYNPALNHIVTAALGVEFPPTGGAISSGGFTTHKVNRYPYAEAWGYVLCEFIVLFTTFYSCYRSASTYKDMRAERNLCHAAEQVHRAARVTRHRRGATGVPYNFESDNLAVSFGGPSELDIVIDLPALDEEQVNNYTLHAAILTTVKRCGLRGIDGEPRPTSKVEGGWQHDNSPTKVRISNFLRSSDRAGESRVVAARQGMSDAILAEYYKERQRSLVWISQSGNVMDVILNIFILIMIGLNATRWVQMQDALEAYTEQLAGPRWNDYFGAFQDFRTVDEMIEFVNGCCMFIGLMKFCGLLKHNTKVKRIILLMQTAGSKVLGSLFVVLAVLAIYSTTGHLLFGAGRPAFATWIGACSELFNTLVGKVSYEKILPSDGNTAVNPLISQMFFVSYAIVNIFITINLFIGILNDAIEVCRGIPESEHDIFTYFWRQAARALGISTKTRTQEEENVAKDVHVTTSAVADALSALEKQFDAFEARSAAVLAQANISEASRHKKVTAAWKLGLNNSGSMKKSAGQTFLDAFRKERSAAAAAAFKVSGQARTRRRSSFIHSSDKSEDSHV